MPAAEAAFQNDEYRMTNGHRVSVLRTHALGFRHSSFVILRRSQGATDLHVSLRRRRLAVQVRVGAPVSSPNAKQPEHPAFQAGR
jgi:hypothetical protein